MRFFCSLGLNGFLAAWFRPGGKDVYCTSFTRVPSPHRALESTKVRSRQRLASDEVLGGR
eukprot:3933084-Rhodomonas_salina.2